MPFQLGAIWAAIKLDTSQFNTAIKQVQGQTAAGAKSATKAGSAYGGMWKKLAMGVGIAGGVALVTRTLANQFSDIVKVGREFESAWANVTTMMGSSAEETKQMRDELIGLSPTLGSTTELAEGMYQVLSASIPEDAAILFLESAAEAAVAGVTDTATAVDALTTVINAYGLEAGDVDEISDVMFATVKSGKLTYDELAGSLGAVIPVAASTGVEFTEISAALATMTKQGIPASTATTQLRGILMKILKPSKQSADLMDKLGIAYGEAALKTKGLSGWLEDLTEKTGGNVDMMALAVEDAQVLTGVLALAGAGAESFAGDLVTMDDALRVGGQTSEALDKQLSTLDVTLDTLATATDKWKTSLYLGFVDGINEAMPNAKDFDEITRMISETMSLLGGTVGKGVVTWIGKFTDNLKTGTAVLSLFKTGWDITITGIKTGNFTLKKAAEAWGDLQKEERDAAAWSDSLAKLMIKGADAMDALTKKVMEQTDATDESMTAHKDLIPEIESTKYEFIDWLQQVADGKMTIEEYNMRIDGMSESYIRLAKDLKDADILDPEDLEPWFTELESLPDATLSVFHQIGLHSLDLKTEIEKHAETMTQETLPEFWENFATSVGMIYGDLLWDIMDKNSTFEEVIKNFFDNWLNMFKSMVSDMVQTWMTDFIKGLLSSSADAGKKITENLAGAIGGEGADSVADAFGSVGSAAGGLLNTLSGIASIVSAIANVAQLFKKPGIGSTAEWHLKEIWMATKQLTDYTMAEIGSSSGWLSRIHDKTNAVVLKNEFQMKQNRKMIGILKTIAKNTGGMKKALGAPKKGQKGAVSFNTEMIQVHGTPSRPEYIIPHEDLSRILSGSGGGSITTNNYISVEIKDQIDPFTADRIVRESMLPAIVRSLETKQFTRVIQHQLGIEI